MPRHPGGKVIHYHYTDAFDRFEYLDSLVQYDLDQFCTLGCFDWRGRGRFPAAVGRD